MPKMKIWDTSLATPAWIELDAKNADTVGGRTASSFANASHGHAISHVENLQLALDSKLNLSGGTMTGDLNVGVNKLFFNSGTTSGTAGMANSDSGAIYGEHNLDTEISRLILEVKDNTDDSIVFRYSDSAATPTVQTILTMKYNTADFGVAPTVNGQKIWYSGNDGTGSGLDADLLDGLDSTAFARSAHTHAIADVTNLQATLDSKSTTLSKAVNALVGTTLTTVATFTPTVAGIFEANAYLRVITAATVTTLKVEWSDPSGAQNNMFVDNTSVAIGSYTFTPIFLNSAANKPITISAVAGTANQVYVSGSIEQK